MSGERSGRPILVLRAGFAPLAATVRRREFSTTGPRPRPESATLEHTDRAGADGAGEGGDVRYG